MKRFIEGEDRYQSTLLPQMLDDYIAEDNPVRVVEAFIDELDLRELGFSGVDPSETGRPGYHPSILLKIYVYGYLNRIQSSRRLEREAGRNVELMWLTGRLTPDFKTIADFRRDHGEAIRAVCRQFIVICRQLNLFASHIVAIDGSKFRAVNNQNKNYTRAKMNRSLAKIEKSLDKYFAQLESADREESALADVKAERIERKIDSLKQKMKELKGREREMLHSPDQQVSLTDPDARAISTHARGSGIVGYNVQAAVESKSHLIVEHEVTNTGSDRSQLSDMANKTKSTLAKKELTVLADRGYYNSKELLACHESNIETFVSKPETSAALKAGRFGKRDFHYDPKKDYYRCPAGEILLRRTTTEENGLTLYRYWSSNCQSCSIKDRCTPGKERRVTRWEHEAILEANQERIDRNPDMMQLRKELVEHPFGTIKTWMGSAHFLTKTLKNVKTEMSLHVLAYNLTRMINIMGVQPLIKAMKA
jgi:transposase